MYGIFSKINNDAKRLEIALTLIINILIIDELKLSNWIPSGTFQFRLWRDSPICVITLKVGMGECKRTHSV